MSSLWTSRRVIGSLVGVLGLFGIPSVSYWLGKDIAHREITNFDQDKPQIIQALSQCESNWVKADQQLRHAQQQESFDKETIRQLQNQIHAAHKAQDALKDEMALIKSIYHSTSRVKEDLIVHPLKVHKVQSGGYQYHFVVSKPNDKQAFKGRLKIQWVGQAPVWNSAEEMKAFLKKTQREHVLDVVGVQDIKGIVHLPPGFTPEEVIVLVSAAKGEVTPVEQHYAWKALIN